MGRDWVSVKFSDVQREFSEAFICGYLQAIFPRAKMLTLRERPKIGKSKVRYTFEEVASKLYNNGKGDMISIIVSPSKKVSYELGIHAYRHGDKISLAMTVFAQYFEEDFTAEVVIAEIINDLVERCKNAYNYAMPSYGRGDWVGIFLDGCSKNLPPEVNDIEGNLKHVFWLNFYGAGIVRRVGLDRFRNAPYGRIERLADGGVLFVRGEHPNEHSEEYKGEMVRRFLFGSGGFLGSIFRRRF